MARKEVQRNLKILQFQDLTLASQSERPAKLAAKVRSYGTSIVR
jgi:hypothetical protein